MIDFEDLIGHDVEFTQGVENFNEYLECGMRATVLHVSKYPEDGLFQVFFDYSKYENFNARLETARFRNENKEGSFITYREMEGYAGMDTFCISAQFECFRLFGTVVLSQTIH